MDLIGRTRFYPIFNAFSLKSGLTSLVSSACVSLEPVTLASLRVVRVPVRDDTRNATRGSAVFRIYGKYVSDVNVHAVAFASSPLHFTSNENVRQTSTHGKNGSNSSLFLVAEYCLPLTYPALRLSYCQVTAGIFNRYIKRGTRATSSSVTRIYRARARFDARVADSRRQQLIESFGPIRSLELYHLCTRAVIREGRGRTGVPGRIEAFSVITRTLYFAPGIFFSTRYSALIT